VTESPFLPPPNFRIRGAAAERLVQIKSELEARLQRPVTWTQVAERLIASYDQQGEG
jgi:hypothetical protein